MCWRRVGCHMSMGQAPRESQLALAFEELYIARCSKKGKHMATAAGWPLFWAVQLATNALFEAEARVRKSEELKLEKDVGMSTLC